MTRIRLIAVTALSFALVALAGCAAKPAASPASSAPASTPASAPADTSAEKATLTMVDPLDGATVAAGSLTVKVRITGLKMSEPSNTNVAGEGHVHFTLDDQPFKMNIKPEMTFENVAAGPHTLKVELVQNDTKPLDPPVTQEIGFTAK